MQKISEYELVLVESTAATSLFTCAGCCMAEKYRGTIAFCTFKQFQSPRDNFQVEMSCFMRNKHYKLRHKITGQFVEPEEIVENAKKQ